MRVADLMLAAPAIAPDVSGGEAYARFCADPDILVLAVVGDDGRPLGLLNRQAFFSRMADHWGRALFERRPITYLMDSEALIVEEETLLSDLSARALDHSSRALTDGFIVVRGGLYAGVGTGAALLKAAARAAEAAAERLSLAVDAANATVWELDLVAGRLLGRDGLSSLLAVPDIAGGLWRTLLDLSPPDHHAALQAQFEALLRQPGRSFFEHPLLERNGEARWLEHSCRSFPGPDGRVARVVGISMDVSDRKRAESEFALAMERAEVALEQKRALLSRVTGAGAAPTPTLPHTVGARIEGRGDSFIPLFDRLARILQEIDIRDRAITEAFEKTEAANAAKSQFLANMSHELRTPLNAILGYSEILEEDLDTPDLQTSRQDASRVQRAARHLLLLINEILDLSKIEAGRMEIVASETRLSALLDEAVDAVRPLAERNRNVLTVQDVGEVERLRTDPMRLKQCLLNLLSNACKFTEDGAVSLEVRRRGPMLAFEVRDTGIGMSEAHLTRLFEPFSQADASITRRYGGTGLGLAITRRLAHLLGGDLLVESRLGAGSCFTLLLPIEEARVEAGPQARGGPCVLVIDDDPAACDLARRALERFGVDVRAAQTGGEGLEAATRLRPDLIILDLHLPDRTGWSVLEALRAEANTAMLPVVVISVEDRRAEALAAGACAHLTKPVERDDLAAAVVRFLRAPSPVPAPASALSPVKQVA